MRRLKYFTFSILILSNLNCKSAYNDKAIMSAQSEVITAFFEQRKDKKLFFKSLVKPSSSSSLPELISYGELNNSHDIIEKRFGVEFKNIFGEEEMRNLKHKAGLVKSIRYDKELSGNITISKEQDMNTLVLSIPIITSNGEYALMYVESSGGGELIVFKKTGKIWKMNYILSDWIS